MSLPKGPGIGSAADAGSRIAGRFPLTTPVPSSQVDPSSSTFAPANDGGHPATTHPALANAARIGKHQLQRLSEQLGERDWAVVRSVAEHRFLTVSQISVLHFHDLSDTSRLRKTQRVLAKLRRHRVLGTLTRRVGGIEAGSSGLVHYVAVVGERLLRLESGKPARQRWHEPSARFADHHLAVADVRLELEIAHRQQSCELVTYQVEATAWRRYVGLGGALITVKPDLYLETATSRDSEFVDCWFIEIDLGNEGIPTLIQKCHDYEQYRRQGIEQEETNGGFPIIIWSLTHKDAAKAERRRQSLTAAIEADRRLDPTLFRVVAPDALLPLIQKGAAL